MKIIILDGLPRFGTSFTARLLNSFPGVFMISDGIRIAREVLQDMGCIDGNFHRYPLALFEGIKINLSDPIRDQDQFMQCLQDEVKALENSVQEAMPEGLAVALSKYLEKSKSRAGVTYHEAFAGFFQIMSDHTGSDLVGTKTTHQAAYASACLDAFPELKWISIVRDPRASYASYMVGHRGSMYHYCAYRWRNHVNSIMALLDNESYRKRVLLLKYEDLMIDTLATAKRLTAFMGLDFDVKKHLDNLDFKRADGKTWRQNSSFTGDGAPVGKDGWDNSDQAIIQYFDPAPINRWKTVLDDVTSEAITRICHRGIEALGYENLSDRSSNRIRSSWVIGRSYLKMKRELLKPYLLSIARWKVIRPILRSLRNIITKRKTG